MLTAWSLSSRSLDELEDVRQQLHSLTLTLMGTSPEDTEFLGAVADEDAWVGVHEDKRNDATVTVVWLRRLLDPNGTSWHQSGGSQFALTDLEAYLVTKYDGEAGCPPDDVEIIFEGAMAHCLMEGYNERTGTPSLSSPRASLHSIGVYGKRDVLIDMAYQLDRLTHCNSRSGRMALVKGNLDAKRREVALSNSAGAAAAGSAQKKKKNATRKRQKKK